MRGYTEAELRQLEEDAAKWRACCCNKPKSLGRPRGPRRDALARLISQVLATDPLMSFSRVLHALEIADNSNPDEMARTLLEIDYQRRTVAWLNDGDRVKETAFKTLENRVSLMRQQVLT